MVKGVGIGAFVNCADLLSVTLPETITYLDREAFLKCNNLKHIYLPDAIESIGIMCFSHCESLEELDFPASATAIPDQCFEYVGLNTDTFELSGYENVKQFGDYSFLYCPIRVIDYSNAESIGFGCLAYSSIEKIILPSDKDDLWYYYHWDIVDICPPRILVLNRIVPPDFSSLDEITLKSCLIESCVLAVPEESLNSYKTDPFWGQFLNIRANSSTGINSIEGDNDFVIEYYDLSGRRLFDLPQQGICIKKIGSKVSKVIVNSNTH